MNNNVIKIFSENNYIDDIHNYESNSHINDEENSNSDRKDNYRTGTGILLKCENDNDEDSNKYNYYLVLTCYHVVKNSKDVYFKILNDNGIDIPYKIIDESSNEDDSEERNDIKAYLIGIEKEYEVAVDHAISFESFFNEESKVYTVGYPGILENDENADYVVLRGSMDVRSKKNNIKAYVLDKYINWYIDYNEDSILKGFSGAPVYNNKNIIGMNCHVPKIGEGNNPYSIIYFIEIYYILNYLKEKCYIISEEDKDKNHRIKWIGNRKEDTNYIDKTLLVIGGSGAGKSSFIKSFARHGDLIDSSGDGQTTRMDIIYEFFLLCDKPKIEINFMNAESFQERMVENLHKSMISLFLIEHFNLEKIDLDDDALSFIKKFYSPLELLIKQMEKNFNVDNSIKKEEEFHKKEEVELFDKIHEFLLRDNTLEGELVDLYFDIIKVLSKLFNNPKVYEFENDVHCIYYFSEDKRKELFDKVKEKYNFKALFGKDKESEEILINNFYKSYKIHKFLDIEYEQINQKEYLKVIYENGYMFKDITRDNLNEEKKDKLTKEIVNISTNKRGYFELSELEFLGCKDDIEKLVKEFVGENFFSKVLEDKYILDPDKYFSLISVNDKETIFKLYKDIIEIINKRVKKHVNKVISDKVLLPNIQLDFKNPSKEIKDFVARCLKVVHSESLSGLIKSIKITDMICDEYAFLFDELNIKGIRFIDTCGLDHVEKGRNLKRILQDTFDRTKINMIEPDAVLYLKKLDSGRPTELENILPLIFEVNPKITLYSAFTGIDILYDSWNANVETLIWDDKVKEYYPKAVKYLLSPEGKKDIQKNLKCRKEKKDLIYAVFARNIVAYCAKVYSKDRINPFRKSNKLNIKRLLKSIILKEHNSVELIDEKIFQDIINSQEFNLELKKCIINIFERASISNWESYHHMIIWANAGRINDENQNYKTLGYWGVYRNLWYQLFDEAYYHVFSVQNEELLNYFTDLKALARIESIIYSIKDDFFGSYINLLNLKLEEHKKSRFRKIFEKMYEIENIYNNNPFSEKAENRPKNLTDNKVKAIEYLKDVVNFSKGLNAGSTDSKTFLDEFVDLFKDCLINKVKSENEECIKNFKRINPDIVLSLNEIQNTINSFFCYNKDKSNNKAFSEEKIDELIKYFISKSI